MKKKLILGVAALLLVGGAACGNDNFRDLKGVHSQEPSTAKVFINVDGNPNIVEICADGVAFATTTRAYNSIMRVPEWDKFCDGGIK